jgi:hypothetical protein
LIEHIEDDSGGEKLGDDILFQVIIVHPLQFFDRIGPCDFLKSARNDGQGLFVHGRNALYQGSHKVGVKLRDVSIALGNMPPTPAPEMINPGA